MASMILIGASLKVVQDSELLTPKDGYTVTMQGPVAQRLHPDGPMSFARNDRSSVVEDAGSKLADFSFYAFFVREP